MLLKKIKKKNKNGEAWQTKGRIFQPACPVTLSSALDRRKIKCQITCFQIVTFWIPTLTYYILMCPLMHNCGQFKLWWINKNFFVLFFYLFLLLAENTTSICEQLFCGGFFLFGWVGLVLFFRKAIWFSVKRTGCNWLMLISRCFSSQIVWYIVECHLWQPLQNLLRNAVILHNLIITIHTQKAFSFSLV